MELLTKLQDIAARIPKQREYVQTEEATKTAFIMPFISALGYNVFDPTEVTPEFTSDIGTKKDEKVDYAIMQHGEPVILIECKHHTVNLGTVQANQLLRYFSVTSVRFGVLTNGIVYQFYTDLDKQKAKQNIMDERPFFVFNLLNFQERDVAELQHFAKTTFDVEYILSHAEELKYTQEILQLINREMQEPSEELTEFFARQVYTGRRMTQATIGYFMPIVHRALKQFVKDEVTGRLKTALVDTSKEAEEKSTTLEQATPEPAEDDDIVRSAWQKEDGIETTEEEKQGYRIVRSLVHEVVDPQRIVMRDVQSYCGILLDDNNQKPICRLWFNRARKKHIGLFDGDDEEKVLIADVEDIRQYGDRLRATVKKYG